METSHYLSHKDYLLNERIQNLMAACSNDGWTGEYSYGISLKIFRFAQYVIYNSPEELIRHFNLFPSPNGTLLLDLKNKNLVGSLSIGENSFSYAAWKESGEQISDTITNKATFDLAIHSLNKIVDFFDLNKKKEKENPCYNCIFYTNKKCEEGIKVNVDEKCVFKKDIVPNDVYSFSISLYTDIDDVYVYVPEGAFDRDEDKVQEKYFTQERIDEIKKKVIEKIQNSENPFSISCRDMDGGYRVSEDMLFREED